MQFPVCFKHLCSLPYAHQVLPVHQVPLSWLVLPGHIDISLLKDDFWELERVSFSKEEARSWLTCQWCVDWTSWETRLLYPVGKFWTGPILWKVEGTDRHAGCADKQGRLCHLPRKEEARMMHKHKIPDLKASFCLTRRFGKRNTILLNFICFVAQKKHSNEHLLN